VDPLCPVRLARDLSPRGAWHQAPDRSWARAESERAPSVKPTARCTRISTALSCAARQRFPTTPLRNCVATSRCALGERKPIGYRYCLMTLFFDGPHCGIRAWKRPRFARCANLRFTRLMKHTLRQGRAILAYPSEVAPHQCVRLTQHQRRTPTSAARTVCRKRFSNSSLGLPFLGLSGTRLIFRNCSAVRSGLFLESRSGCICFRFSLWPIQQDLTSTSR
jgi:hypothetical protein